jgi:uracil-DNA glycosylase
MDEQFGRTYPDLMAPGDARETALAAIFERVHRCRLCPRVKASETRRVSTVLSTAIDTMVVSQSPAENFVRRSGVQCFNTSARLGTTGTNFEKFLNRFGRTLFPPRPVQLASGATVPAAEPPLRSVYYTDLLKCFPGKRGKGQGDRTLLDSEVATCWDQGFLTVEIEIVRSRLVLLMGKESWTAFAQRLLGANPRAQTIESMIDLVSNTGALPRTNLGDHEFAYLPVPHSSGANMKRFAPFLKRESIFDALCRAVATDGRTDGRELHRR